MRSNQQVSIMAEQEWSKNAIFDPALVRRAIEEQVHIEPPIDVATACAASPPEPGQEAIERRAVLADPQVVQFWQQRAADTPQADPPPDAAATLAQMSMALYYLQALHSQDKPGRGHMSRDESTELDEDADE
jgi:hypothetical protein